MALGDINDKWPYTGFNFDVRVGGKYYSFKEVSGLELNIETTTKPEGSFIYTVPTGQRKFGTLKLKRGMLPGGSDFANWAKLCEANPEITEMPLKDVDVYMMDDQGNDLMHWAIKDAWPKKYTVGPLNSSENGLAVEDIELVYRYFEVTAML